MKPRAFYCHYLKIKPHYRHFNVRHPSRKIILSRRCFLARLAKKKNKNTDLTSFWLSGCLSSPRWRRWEQYRRQTQASNSKDSTLHIDYFERKLHFAQIKTKGKAGHLITWRHENHWSLKLNHLKAELDTTPVVVLLPVCFFCFLCPQCVWNARTEMQGLDTVQSERPTPTSEITEEMFGLVWVLERRKKKSFSVSREN